MSYLAQTKLEIEYYPHMPKRIAKAMLELAKRKYSPTGHGCGLGCEDWSMNRDFSTTHSVAVIFIARGRSTIVNVDMYVGESYFTYYEGRIGGAMKVLNKIRTLTDLKRACEAKLSRG